VATPGPIRVLIVDDSALMRKLLKDLLSGSEEIEVVGLANDGEHALEQAVKLQPDVITLDVEMPGRSGLEILPDLLARRPVPVLMISSLTQEGAETTLAALALGAVDYLPKPSSQQLSNMRAAGELVVAKVKAASRCRVMRQRTAGLGAGKPPSSTQLTPVASALASASASATAVRPRGAAWPAAAKPAACVVVGISTGGPQALDQVLPMLRRPIPPMVVVQHMPGSFTGVFARRLAKLCGVHVAEAEAGMRLLPDQILIAPGGKQLTLVGHQPLIKVALSDDPPVSGHRPSVDVLFRSAAQVFGAGVVGVIMTGMGRDGADGCKAILAAGGATFGQDEATSVVYGMNKAAFVESAITRQFSLFEFADLIRSVSPG